MSEKSSIHLLSGLEADNLLAFLALLGLLRVINTARPEWQASVYWAGMPLAARLTVKDTVDRSMLLLSVIEGVATLTPAYGFDENKDIVYSQNEFRNLCKRSITKPRQLEIIAALGSDGCLKRDKDVIEPTPYCAIFGQGHQHFLARLREVVAYGSPSPTKALKKEVFEQALFNEWMYTDTTPSFRWDPQEDRRYALQFGNPSEERNKIGTVAGANTLAAIGFMQLITAPTQHGLEALGVMGRRGANVLCWPLPGVPTTLNGYMALMRHPDMHSRSAAPALAAYGITGVARANRIQVGKFFNFERAVIQTLDQ